MDIQYRKISDIRNYDKNQKKHPGSQVEKIANSIREFGFNTPILIDKNNEIIAGHGRLLAAKRLKMSEVPCVIIDNLTPEQIKKYRIADNKTNESDWDIRLLEEEMKALLEAGEDLLSTGFDTKEIEEMMPSVFNEFVESLPDDNELKATYELEGSQIQGLVNEVKFPGAGKWDLPVIRKDRILDPEKVPLLYNPKNPDTSDNILLWNYGSDSTRDLDWTRCIIGFYVEDVRFECLWNDTAKYVTDMINKKVYGLIAPNYSCYYAMPRAIRLFNTFRSRYVARYVQEAGIPILPDIQGHATDGDWIFDGIPLGIPISFQCHREEKKHAKIKNETLKMCLDRINPPIVWCYGQEHKKEWYPALRDVDCRWITPRTIMMRENIYGKES